MGAVSNVLPAQRGLDCSPVSNPGYVSIISMVILVYDDNFNTLQHVSLKTISIVEVIIKK